MSGYPSAQYTAPGVNKSFTTNGVPLDSLTSNGSTSGPSPYLLQSTNGTYVDKDKPSDLNLDSSMGRLRGYVTKLQDDINVYLTERIKETGNDALDQESVLEQDVEEDSGEDQDIESTNSN